MSGDEPVNERNRALRHVLAAVDAAPPGAYTKIVARRNMLQDLITQHSLRDVFKPGQAAEWEGDLTVERFESIIKTTAATAGSSISRLSERGSKTWSRSVRSKIGYANQAAQGSSRTTSGTQNAPTRAPSQTSAKETDAKATTGTSSPTRAESPDVIVGASEQTSAKGKDSTGLTSESAAASSTSKRKRAEREEQEAGDLRPAKVSRTVSTAANTTTSPLMPPPSLTGHAPHLGKKRALESVEERQVDDGPSRKSPKLAPEISIPAPSPAVGSEDSEVQATVAHQKRKRDQEGQEDGASPPGSKRARTGSLSSISSTDVQSRSVLRTDSASKGENAAPNASASRATSGAAVADDTARSIAPVRDIDEADAWPSDPPKIPHPFDMIYPPEPILGELRSGNQGIADAFRTMRGQLESFGVWIKCANSQYEEAPVPWLQDPSPELEELFVSLFGPRWQRYTREASLAGASRFFDGIVILAAAAIKKYVWDQPLPWKSAKDRVAEFEEERHLWNGFLRDYGKFTAQRCLAPSAY